MKSLLVTLVFSAAATVAPAQLVNPSFETGNFIGWTASDFAYVYSSDEESFTGIPPFDGGYYAALFPGGSMFQTIHLRAGETVSAWMNGSWGTGYLNLIPSSGPTIQVPYKPVYLPDGNIAKWNQISLKIQQDGIYSIGASSGNIAEGGPAFIAVDLFTITPVPESSSYGLLAAVSGVAAIVWRRRKASAAA